MLLAETIPKPNHMFWKQIAEIKPYGNENQ